MFIAVTSHENNQQQNEPTSRKFKQKFRAAKVLSDEWQGSRLSREKIKEMRDLTTAVLFAHSTP